MARTYLRERADASGMTKVETDCATVFYSPDIRNNPQGSTIIIDSDGSQAYRWSTRPGNAWPCATLPDLDEFTVEFVGGDLVDMVGDHIFDDPARDDGYQNRDDVTYTDGHELMAFCVDQCEEAGLKEYGPTM